MLLPAQSRFWNCVGRRYLKYTLKAEVVLKAEAARIYIPRSRFQQGVCTIIPKTPFFFFFEIYTSIEPKSMRRLRLKALVPPLNNEVRTGPHSQPKETNQRENYGNLLPLDCLMIFPLLPRPTSSAHLLKLSIIAWRTIKQISTNRDWKKRFPLDQLCILLTHPSLSSAISSSYPSPPNYSTSALSAPHVDRSRLHACLSQYGSHRICKKSQWYCPVCFTSFGDFLCQFCSGCIILLLFISSWLFSSFCTSHTVLYLLHPFSCLL